MINFLLMQPIPKLSEVFKITTANTAASYCCAVTAWKRHYFRKCHSLNTLYLKFRDCQITFFSRLHNVWMFSYELEEDPLGVRFKIWGSVEWVKSINFMIKPAIKYNVMKNLKASGDLIRELLQLHAVWTCFFFCVYKNIYSNTVGFFEIVCDSKQRWGHYPCPESLM